jgi:signal transduction histidine kinase
MRQISLLIYTTDPASTRRLERQLRRLGYDEVVGLVSLADADTIIARRQPDLLIVELRDLQPADLDIEFRAIQHEAGFAMITIDRRTDRSTQRITEPQICLQAPYRSRELDLIIQATIAQANARQRERAFIRFTGLGALIGGVTHEFNNILTTISGNADLALLDIPIDHEAHVSIEHIQVSVQRATMLTRQIMLLAGRLRSQSPTRDAIAIIREMRPLLALAAGKRITIHYTLDPGPALLAEDTTNLRHLLIGLILHAAAHIYVGEIELVARHSATQLWIEVQSRPHAIANSDEQALIYAARSPLTSTVGLHVVEDVVRTSSGSIEAQQTAGGGTQVYVMLQLTAEE